MFLPAAALITNLLKRPGFFGLFDAHGDYGVYIKLKCLKNTLEQVPKSWKKSHAFGVISTSSNVLSSFCDPIYCISRPNAGLNVNVNVLSVQTSVT